MAQVGLLNIYWRLLGN